jgi:two-component system sensor histidine kinase/response regulator
MPKKILVVDDYVEFARLLEGRLRSEGFEAEVVHDGPSAVQKARSLKPDLIILDIMMPEVGGNEVCLELMKDPVTRDIPVIFLTGLRAPQTKHKPKNNSSRVIGKSKDFKELLDAIREELKD